MRLLTVFTLFFSFSLIYSDDIIQYLSNIPSNTPFLLSDVQNVAIFVSASADSNLSTNSELLTRIYIEDGKGVMKNVQDIRNTKIDKNSDLMGGWFTNGPIRVSTQLDPNSLQTLTGFIYLRNSSLITSTNSQVYDVSQKNSLNLKRSDHVAVATVIFLNSLVDRSTSIWNFQHDNSQAAQLYLGLPAKTEGRGNLIYSNPVEVNRTYYEHIAHVEPFSINDAPIFYGYFYGGADLLFGPGRVEPPARTLDYSTTGVIFKSSNDPDVTKTINFSKSGNLTTGISGFNVVVQGFQGSASYLRIDLKTGKDVYTKVLNNDKQGSFSIDGLANNITVSSFSTTGYYIQYFYDEEAPVLNPTSTSSPIQTTKTTNDGRTTTVKDPETTTTKSARAAEFLILISVFLIKM